MNLPHNPHDPSRTVDRWSGALGLTAVSVCLAVIIVIGVRATLLYEGRVAVRDDAREANLRVALIAARTLSDDISTCSYALSVLGTAGQGDPSAQLSKCLTQFGYPRSMNARSDAQAVLVDEAGEIVYEALPSTTCVNRPMVQRIVDADRRRDSTQLSISTSSALCPESGERGLLMTHGIRRDDGEYAGVGIVTLDVRYFSRQFAGLAPRAQGVVSLLRSDGVVLVRSTAAGATISDDISNAADLATSASSSGTAPVSGADGDFLYVRQPLPSLPMQIEIRAPKSEIYAAWRERALWVAGLTATLGTACLLLAVLLRKQRQRRRAAEAELQRMASTDPLTGLANRRTLDEIYDREWRRSVRERVPLALLFIDVDHFKTFNDRYGHPAGDDALIAVSHAIGHSVRRPGDFAGRYGGEEFMVVLPNTDVRGARDVAERVRTTLRAAAIPHEGTQHGHVTVSIGIAATGATATGTPAALLQAADEALYAAKSGGRDCVYVHATSGGDPCPAI
ncbi:GGDEF domain-containing protein [Pandoraea sp. PE-S2R-1]|uniref:sensor domain-containing diguanylate cyclase n=1 Tax=Pandoraea sp. PE-S2R-1 TaxID=1986994 RepID=UPI000B3FA7F8|nr:GGDEF domain-containing protein [Pandoraea sp. PE-S2R-1]